MSSENSLSHYQLDHRKSIGPPEPAQKHRAGRARYRTWPGSYPGTGACPGQRQWISSTSYTQGAGKAQEQLSSTSAGSPAGLDLGGGEEPAVFWRQGLGQSRFSFGGSMQMGISVVDGWLWLLSGFRPLEMREVFCLVDAGRGHGDRAAGVLTTVLPPVPVLPLDPLPVSFCPPHGCCVCTGMGAVAGWPGSHRRALQGPPLPWTLRRRGLMLCTPQVTPAPTRH